MERTEAVKIIRDTYHTEEELKALETLIPELKESEDERIRKWLIDYFKNVGNTWIHREISPEQILSYLEKQKDHFRIVTKMVEQKPAWSDADNIGWDEAFACVTRTEKAAKNEEELQNAVTAEKWLKEIKFKYYVHPIKQEWSEEDEKKLELVIDCIYEFYPDPVMKYKLKDWLKSLRPHWKPSEEQMAALKEASASWMNEKMGNAELLQSLYDALKKLM